MRVLLLRTWGTNIGNSIIEKGAKNIVQQAYPESEIVEVSTYANYLASRYETVNPDKQTVWNDLKLRISDTEYLSKIAKPIYNFVTQLGSTGNNMSDNETTVPDQVNRWGSGSENLNSIAKFVDADLVVVAGCILDAGLEILRPTLAKFSNKDIPIVFVGAGGGNYDDDVVEYVRDTFDSLDVSGLISRDETAFKKYGPSVKKSYNGIDCGLFINDWYSPPAANQPFAAVTFDKSEEPVIKSDFEILRLNHAPYRNPAIGLTNKNAAMYKSNYYEPIGRGFFKSDNAIVSDIIEDYLFVYANSEIVMSDRIHACIPALAYGNEAKFYFDTPRAKLFENLSKRGIIDAYLDGETMKANQTRLSEEKETQIKEFKRIVDKVT